ncbi:hypothetical protein C7M84_012963 [Penaeus vannamei]|uniref:Uncharacterized protein n=1 Tax=Penaeus vannamei TaxID=6689 RepID=A0A3R7M140_PENVA|nr:hypothetical protein C7M84_012963 [Penaeus vannamei]
MRDKLPRLLAYRVVSVCEFTRLPLRPLSRPWPCIHQSRFAPISPSHERERSAALNLRRRASCRATGAEAGTRATPPQRCPLSQHLHSPATRLLELPLALASSSPLLSSLPRLLRFLLLPPSLPPPFFVLFPTLLPSSFPRLFRSLLLSPLPPPLHSLPFIVSLLPSSSPFSPPPSHVSSSSLASLRCFPSPFLASFIFRCSSFSICLPFFPLPSLHLFLHLPPFPPHSPFPLPSPPLPVFPFSSHSPHFPFSPSISLLFCPSLFLLLSHFSPFPRSISCSVLPNPPHSPFCPPSFFLLPLSLPVLSHLHPHFLTSSPSSFFLFSLPLISPNLLPLLHRYLLPPFSPFPLSVPPLFQLPPPSSFPFPLLPTLLLPSSSPSSLSLPLPPLLLPSSSSLPPLLFPSPSPSSPLHLLFLHSFSLPLSPSPPPSLRLPSPPLPSPPSPSPSFSSSTFIFLRFILAIISQVTFFQTLYKSTEEQCRL